MKLVEHFPQSLPNPLANPQLPAAQYPTLPTRICALSVLVEGKILGSRHRHANDTNLHEKVSLAVFFNRRLGRGLLTCMKSQSRCVKTVPAEYENRLRKSVTFTASSRDLKVKPMSYNSYFFTMERRVPPHHWRHYPLHYRWSQNHRCLL
ncbi:hypothetical protein J6590_041237 [Homalodisca vitripennis]|nr:hypothetical protein J6590_041237 [Homalodisca vitripennis]